MTDWDKLVSTRDYDGIAEAIIENSPDFDYELLRIDPIGALEDRADLQLIIDSSFPESDCSGGGYYRRNPAEIYLHPTMWRRDNFTVLHELGHHLQCLCEDWAFAVLDMRTDQQRLFEEGVSHAIAARILLPAESSEQDWESANIAVVMARLYSESQASRSAVLRRVQGLLPANSRWILAIADLNGKVIYAATTYSDAPPAIGSVQPALADLAIRAREAPVVTNLSEAIEYRSRQVLGDLKARAAIDPEGRHVFIALSPHHRYSTGDLFFRTADCANPVCDATFEVNEDIAHCPKCSAPSCPLCNRCDCNSKKSNSVCHECWEVLSPAEVADNSHECRN